MEVCSGQGWGADWVGDLRFISSFRKKKLNHRNLMSNILDIEDRGADYKLIYDQAFRAEHRIRAISYMYDDHSEDINSYENILKLKDNIYYRILSATHQYLVLLRELQTSEDYLQDLYKQNPHYLNAFPLDNPYL